MTNIEGHDYPTPTTVPATLKFMEMIAQSGMTLLDDFHFAVDGSMTLVDPETRSAITLLIFESAELDD